MNETGPFPTRFSPIVSTNKYLENSSLALLRHSLPRIPAAWTRLLTCRKFLHSQTGQIKLSTKFRRRFFPDLRLQTWWKIYHQVKNARAFRQKQRKILKEESSINWIWRCVLVKKYYDDYWRNICRWNIILMQSWLVELRQIRNVISNVTALSCHYDIPGHERRGCE